MTAVLMLQPFAVVPSWVLYAITLCALVAVGISYFPEWRKSRLLTRGLVVAGVLSVFILVGFDCGGYVPDWLCFLI